MIEAQLPGQIYLEGRWGTGVQFYDQEERLSGRGKKAKEEEEEERRDKKRRKRKWEKRMMKKQGESEKLKWTSGEWQTVSDRHCG